MTKEIEEAIELFESVSGSGDYIAAGRTLAAAYRAKDGLPAVAEAAAEKIIADLDDRVSLDIRCFDQEVQDEIKASIVRIITESTLAAKGADDAN